MSGAGVSFVVVDSACDGAFVILEVDVWFSGNEIPVVVRGTLAVVEASAATRVLSIPFGPELLEAVTAAIGVVVRVGFAASVDGTDESDVFWLVEAVVKEESGVEE